MIRSKIEEEEDVAAAVFTFTMCVRKAGWSISLSVDVILSWMMLCSDML